MNRMPPELIEKTNHVDRDGLVVGGGVAGLWAAIRAKEFCPGVTLVDNCCHGNPGPTLKVVCKYYLPTDGDR